MNNSKTNDINSVDDKRETRKYITSKKTSSRENSSEKNKSGIVDDVLLKAVNKAMIESGDEDIVDPKMKQEFIGFSRKNKVQK